MDWNHDLLNTSLGLSQLSYPDSSECAAEFTSVIWTRLESEVWCHHSKCVISLPYCQKTDDMQWNVSHAQPCSREKLSTTRIHPGMCKCQCNILHPALINKEIFTGVKGPNIYPKTSALHMTLYHRHSFAWQKNPTVIQTHCWLRNNSDAIFSEINNWLTWIWQRQGIQKPCRRVVAPTSTTRLG